MTRTLSLLLLLTASAAATPVFPDFTRDDIPIKSSSFIGQSITSPGRYLFALEDIPCPACDGDYNDVYGEVVWYGGAEGRYTFTVQGGLGAYFGAGKAGLAGAVASGDILTLLFNVPTGQFSSGTPQVLIYRLGDVAGTPTGASVPEPGTLAGCAASLLLLAALRCRGTIGSNKKGVL